MNMKNKLKFWENFEEILRKVIQNLQAEGKLPVDLGWDNDKEKKIK
mgnify:CR=1 FL=1